MKGIFSGGYFSFFKMIFFLVGGVLAIYITSLCGRLIYWLRSFRGKFND